MFGQRLLRLGCFDTQFPTTMITKQGCPKTHTRDNIRLVPPEPFQVALSAHLISPRRRRRQGSHTAMLSSKCWTWTSASEVPGLFSLFSAPVVPFLGPIEQADAPHPLLRIRIAFQRASRVVIRLCNTGPILPIPNSPSLSVDHGMRAALCLGALWDKVAMVRPPILSESRTNRSGGAPQAQEQLQCSRHTPLPLPRRYLILLPTSAPISVWYAPRCLTEGKDLIDLFTMTLLDGVFLELSLPCVMRKKSTRLRWRPCKRNSSCFPLAKNKSICRPCATYNKKCKWKRANDVLQRLQWPQPQLRPLST